MEWHRLVRGYENLVVAETVSDIRAAKKDGRAAFVIAAQGADWVGRQLYRVEAMQRIGLRQLLFAYNIMPPISSPTVVSTAPKADSASWARASSKPDGKR